MDVTGQSDPISDTASHHHDHNLLDRVEFGSLKKIANWLGGTVFVLFGIVALLHRWMLISPTVDFSFLLSICIMLAVVGVVLWVLVSRWNHRHQLPPTPTYMGKDASAKTLDKRRQALSREARLHSGKRQFWVVVAALLSPVAVFLLSIEILLLPSGKAAPWLISAEILIIGGALVTVYVRWPFGKAHETWVPARLRAELLRRELFLYRARVGPYLDCPDRPDEVDKRIHEIAEREIDDAEEELLRLAALLDMRQDPEPGDGISPSLCSWSDALEDRYRRAAPRDEKINENDKPEADFGPSYLTERICAQKFGYFAIQKELHERLDVCWEIMSLLTLWAALSVASLHLGLMTGRHDAGTVHLSPIQEVENWSEVFALTLPPLGALFIALRTQFEDHRLSRSYDDQFWQLDRLEKQMSKQMENAALSEHSPEVDLQIKRLVLETEMLLSHEVRRWWHIVGPEIPKGS